jgi:hypothetical protein
VNEDDLEKRVDESVAKFESWYARLPLAVRVLGDILCLGLIIYVVAWVASSLELFEISSPNAWAWSTWGFILVVSAALCLGYELMTRKARKS